MKEIRNSILILLVLVLSSCSLASREPDFKDYGYGAKRDAQVKYFKSLGDDDYIDQETNWEQKLESRKINFNNIMKREYLGFAANLQKDKDYSDATFFRRKGIDAGRSDFDILPEEPARWKVKSEDELDELSRARLQLIDSLVGYSPIVAPTEAAKSIVYFDCWVQQSQGKKGQYNKDNCRKTFEANYYKLEDIAGNIRGKELAEINDRYRFVTVEKSVDERSIGREMVAVIKGKEPTPVPAFKPKSKPEEIILSPEEIAADEQRAKDAAAARARQAAAAKKAAASPATAVTSTGVIVNDSSLITDKSDKNPDIIFVAYFDGKSEVLTPAATAELDKAVAQIKASNAKSVSINGHTDRSFDSSGSLVSSKKRADAARDYLVSKGISKDIIRTYGFGKTDNLVENKEGEAKPANNRAEIVFKGVAK